MAVIDAPDRAALNEAWKAWMEEHVAATGSVPPGNESGNKLWTTRKVKRVKPEIKLTPGKHVALNVPIVEVRGEEQCAPLTRAVQCAWCKL